MVNGFSGNSNQVEGPSKFIQRGAVAVGSFFLIKRIFGALLFSALFVVGMVIGILPWWIGVPAILLIILFFVLEIIRIKRISKAF